MKGWRAKKQSPALGWALAAGLLASALWCGDAGAQISTIKVLYPFTGGGGDGADPEAGLILSSDGTTLYGTTAGGGESFGTVFALPTSGAGVLNWTNQFPNANGTPFAALTLSSDGTTLYGTTSGSGSPTDYGTVFAVLANGEGLITLTAFTGQNGGNPYGGLTLSSDGTTLYGTTLYSSTNATRTLSGNGTVFSVPTNGGTPTMLVSFTGTSGANLGTSPFASLTLSKDGKTLYGTTGYGGTNGWGTVFAVPTNGGSLTWSVSFTGGADGANPEAALTLSSDGTTLYGTASEGGSGFGFSGNGTVFKVTLGENGMPTASSYPPTTLWTFTGGADGETPYAALALSSDGSTLYGTASGGGSGANGTVFALPTAGGPLTTLVAFPADLLSGDTPDAGVILSPDGSTLYGTTAGGGSGNGTVFEVKSNLLVFTTQPVSTIAYWTLSGITVQMQDPYGNPLPYSGTSITLTLNGGTVSGGTLTQVTDGTGTATFDDLVIDTAASGLTFTATASPLLPATSTPFDIAAVGTVANTGSATWNSSGSGTWVINDATGTAGGSSGWDLLNITDNLNIDSTSADPFTINLVSFDSDVPGPAANFNSQTEYTWQIVAAGGSVVNSGGSGDLTLNTGQFQNFTGGGTFSLEQGAASVDVVFTPHVCDPSDTILADTTTNSQAQLIFTNNYGLSAVEAINLNNCTITGGTAFGFGFPTGTPIVGSMTLDNIVALPNGTTSLVLFAARTVSGPAVVNAGVYDECDNFAAFDPVIAQLIAQAGASLWQTYSSVPSAEHYVTLANGTPGLGSVKLLVNGWTYNLGTVADGQTVVVDIGASMNPGASNTILVVASGGQGATASIQIADAANGPLLQVQPQVEAPVLSFFQQGGSVVLSWPAPAGFFTLQGRASLDPATDWQDLAVTQQQSQGLSFVTIQSSAGSQWFRLRK